MRGVGTARSCHTGTFAAGKTVTDFRIENGNVTSVTVGIVIDWLPAPELAGQADRVEDRLRLLARARPPVRVQPVAVPAPGERGQRARATSAPVVTPSPTGGAASSLR